MVWVWGSCECFDVGTRNDPDGKKRKRINLKKSTVFFS